MLCSARGPATYVSASSGLTQRYYKSDSTLRSLALYVPCVSLSRFVSYFLLAISFAVFPVLRIFMCSAGFFFPILSSVLYHVALASNSRVPRLCPTTQGCLGAAFFPLSIHHGTPFCPFRCRRQAPLGITLR